MDRFDWSVLSRSALSSQLGPHRRWKHLLQALTADFPAGRKLSQSFVNNNMGGPGQSFTNNNGPATPTAPVTAGAHLLESSQDHVHSCPEGCSTVRNQHQVMTLHGHVAPS